MNNIWFTSDNHFGHINVIKYCNRPFETASEMDEAMISNWNERVKPGDTVYHLGDFSFHNTDDTERIFKRLNGRIKLSRGNHDKGRNIGTIRFDEVRDMYSLRLGTVNLVMCHYALRVWNRSHYGAIQLFGHSHGSLSCNSQQLDVGVDCWDFKPVNLDEIRERLQSLPPYKGEDHHQAAA